MSLITYNGLLELVEQGVITGIKPENINAASIDVRLGAEVLTERKHNYPHLNLCDIAEKVMPSMDAWTISPDGFCLPPGGVVLAHTVEYFNLPDDIAIEFKLKSSTGRSFLNHMLAGWGDPGWHGSQLTLEFKNDLQYHTHVLRAGMKVGQVVFWRGERVPESASYRTKGRYNETTGAVEGKGV